MLIQKEKLILCTVGPATLHPAVIRRLSDLGVALFRLNLSHTDLKDIRPTITFLQKHSRVSICIDSEGAQARTGRFTLGSVYIDENAVVTIPRCEVMGNSKEFNITPELFLDAVGVGDLLTIDFDGVVAQVLAVKADQVVLRVLNCGTIGSNRAVTLHREISLPAITEKDRQAIEIGLEHGVSHYALSFANTAEDVKQFRKLIGSQAKLISKIETRRGVKNLEEIAQLSDAILIDRGDLSREIPLEEIPARQKYIIGRAKGLQKRVFVATNLLESMTRSPRPTRAEINDVYNTLADGADGLVLAAETAIGKHPVACVAMVARVVKEFDTQRERARTGMPEMAEDASLFERYLPHGERAAASRMPRLVLSVEDLMDAEQLALGTYSPVRGFMGQHELDSVLAKNQLPDGRAWTMPIILQVPRKEFLTYQVGDRLALASKDGEACAVLDVRQRFKIDLKSTVKTWFGTESTLHPGAARVWINGPYCLAGTVQLLHRLPSAYAAFLLTPAQTRFLFLQKGWERVVSFHTRNVIHRAHEWIQLEALRRTEADGLLISPVIGPKKPGDFKTSTVLAAYQACIESGVYPEGRVILSGFASYPRYAGPREAVFTALCRRNMGCSHFIVGRDHTGVGDFYKPEEYQDLFHSIGDLGIRPVFFEKIGYDRVHKRYAEDHSGLFEPISGSRIRSALQQGSNIPDWIMRGCVMDVIRSTHNPGRGVFA